MESLDRKKGWGIGWRGEQLVGKRQLVGEVGGLVGRRGWWKEGSSGRKGVVEGRG